MERLVDLGSLVRTLKAGLHKPNPANPDRKMWLLTDLDKKNGRMANCGRRLQQCKIKIPKRLSGRKTSKPRPNSTGRRTC